MDDPTVDTSHRPWPLPDGPWVMAQTWNDLLFAHWPVETEAVRALVPPALTLDRYADTAWVTITPFHISDLHARGLPTLPWGAKFPELNVRTYVTLGGKPGVFFFSLDAGDPLAVTAARALYHLPYFRASMDVRRTADEVVYHSRRTHAGAPEAEFRARYRATGDVASPDSNTLDHWLTERYCLYAVAASDHVYRAEIHHRPWSLQPAIADIHLNTMAAAAGIALPAQPPRVSYARRLDVVVWLPQRLDVAAGPS